MKTGVIGGGAWGTALAVSVGARRAVTLWARDPAPIRAARASPRLPGIALPARVGVVDALPGPGFDAVLLAVPVPHLGAVAAGLRTDAPLLVCAKGVEAGSGRLPLELLDALHPGHPAAVLSGPNFAHEVAAGLPAAPFRPDPDWWHHELTK